MLKTLTKGLVKRLGYRLSRLRPANRFEGMEDALMVLRRGGFVPQAVIDGGANVGQWTRLAKQIFPEASFHLVEPQPACADALKALTKELPQTHYYPVALGSGVTRELRLSGQGSTGAFVREGGSQMDGAIICPARTLDELFADQVKPGERTLLKLDLEGYELTALAGGEKLLKLSEVVILETQVFSINNNRSTVLFDYASYMRERGMEIYDIASLSPRPRDQRLRMADIVFARQGSPLLRDLSWE